MKLFKRKLNNKKLQRILEQELFDEMQEVAHNISKLNNLNEKMAEIFNINDVKSLAIEKLFNDLNNIMISNFSTDISIFREHYISQGKIKQEKYNADDKFISYIFLRIMEEDSNISKAQSVELFKDIFNLYIDRKSLIRKMTEHYKEMNYFYKDADYYKTKSYIFFFIKLIEHCKFKVIESKGHDKTFIHALDKYHYIIKYVYKIFTKANNILKRDLTNEEKNIILLFKNKKNFYNSEEKNYQYFIKDIQDCDHKNLITNLLCDIADTIE